MRNLAPSSRATLADIISDRRAAATAWLRDTIAPSSLTALPHPTHNLAELESAFNARRLELAHHERVTAWIASIAPQVRTVAPHRAPRDGRGRFLSKAWLQRAETFTAADLAFFRSPLNG